MSTWSSPRHGLTWHRRRLRAQDGFGFGLALFLGAIFMLRVLVDDTASSNSRQSGSFDLSGAIAVVFILVASVLLFRRRRGVLPTILATLWLCVWTAVAVSTNGASTETLREGVRELSVLALAVIVYNARGAVSVPSAARIVQLVGVIPAVIALHQLAAHTGIDVGGEIRANGTFAHPDSAAMFFALAAVASLWLYLDGGRRRADVLLMALFAVALIATFSIDGLITLAAMLTALGMLRPGSLRVKLGPCAIAGVVVLAFFATPLGAHRLSRESSTSLASEERGEANSSLAWRLHKWETLRPKWEAAPLFGQGLGTTTTEEPILGSRYAGKPPHNEYVRYLVETGVVGLAILLAALAFLIRALLRKRQIRGSPNASARDGATLALVFVIGCLVDALADNTLLNSPTCYAVALVVAAALASPSIDARQALIPQTA
jgi:O-antigen ligase